MKERGEIERERERKREESDREREKDKERMRIGKERKKSLKNRCAKIVCLR